MKVRGKKKRCSPSHEDDPGRLAENLFSQYGEAIRDKDTFDLKYDDYLNEYPEAIGNKWLRENTMKHFKAKHPYFGAMEAVVKPGRRPGRVVRPGRRERALVRRRQQDLSMFRYMGKEKTRTVYARKTSFVDYRGKTRIVYRDLKGRFARRLK